MVSYRGTAYLGGQKFSEPGAKRSACSLVCLRPTTGAGNLQGLVNKTAEITAKVAGSINLVECPQTGCRIGSRCGFIPRGDENSVTSTSRWRDQ